MTLLSLVAGLAVVSAAPVLYAAASGTASHQLAADLRLTRTKAIAQNTRFQIVIDTVQGTYTIQRENMGTFVDDEGPIALPHPAMIVDVSPGNFIFNTRGGINASTTITVEVPGRPSHSVAINLLGRVSVT
jgi:Tfp pilus assembly protein FimT